MGNPAEPGPCGVIADNAAKRMGGVLAFGRYLAPVGRMRGRIDLGAGAVNGPTCTRFGVAMWEPEHIGYIVESYSTI